MRSLRAHSSAGLLVLALLAACFSAGGASGQDANGRLSGWDHLKSLTQGQEIRVVMNNAKSYQGEFESLSDDGITLRQAAGEQTLERTDVRRVLAKGKSHLTRNFVIGAFIGAGAGFGIGLSPYLVPRNCTEGPAFGCGYPPNPHLLEILMPVGALAGAAIGAAVPTGGWHTVYRARRRPTPNDL